MTASALDDSTGIEPPSGGASATELAAIGGSGTMRLDTFDGFHQHPAAAPTASSMRVMETGLAFLAIVVALLLNLGR